MNALMSWTSDGWEKKVPPERLWVTRRFLGCRNVKMLLFERRDPNLKDNIEFVAVCG